jgi:hypothetical protein
LAAAFLPVAVFSCVSDIAGNRSTPAGNVIIAFFESRNTFFIEVIGKKK